MSAQKAAQGAPRAEMVAVHRAMMQMGLHLGGLLGASWGLLGPSWGLLGPSRGGRLEFSIRGPPLGPLLGPSWGPLGLSWAPLGPSWGPLGPSQGSLWGLSSTPPRTPLHYLDPSHSYLNLRTSCRTSAYPPIHPDPSALSPKPSDPSHFP